MNSKKKTDEKQILTLENEIWKTVEKHPSYEISNFGRCKRTYKNGKQIILEPITNGQGQNLKQRKRDYQFFRLNGIKLYAHYLVLTAFIGPRPEGHQCDHINSKRTDNRLENLRWLPMAENCGHKGEAHPSAKLTDKKVIAARSVYQQLQAVGVTMKSIGEMFGVSGVCIKRAITGQSWSHI